MANIQGFLFDFISVDDGRDLESLRGGGSVSLLIKCFFWCCNFYHQMKTKKMNISKSKRPNRLPLFKTEPIAEFEMSSEEPHMYQTKKYLMDLTQESEDLSSSYQFNPQKPHYDLSLTQWNNLSDKAQKEHLIYASLRDEIVPDSKQQLTSSSDLNHSERNITNQAKKSKVINLRQKHNHTELKERKSPENEEKNQIFELKSLNCSISNQTFKVKSQSICLKQLNLQIKVSNNIKKKRGHNPSKFEFLSSSIEKQRESIKKLPEIQRLHGIHGHNKNKYNLLFKAPQPKKLQALVLKSASIINQSNFLVLCQSTK